MPKSEDINVQLSAYFDGEVSRRKQLIIKQKLENSPGDAFELMQVTQVDQLLRQLDSIETTDQFLLELMRRVSEIPLQEGKPLTLLTRCTKKFQSWLAFLRYRLRLKFHSVTVGVAAFISICVAIFFFQAPPTSQKVNVPLMARSIDRLIRVDLVSVPIAEKQSIISPIRVEGER